MSDIVRQRNGPLGVRGFLMPSAHTEAGYRLYIYRIYEHLGSEFLFEML